MKIFKPYQVPGNIMDIVHKRINEIDNCELCGLEFEEGVDCRAFYSGILKLVRLYCIECFKTVNKIFTMNVEIVKTLTEN